MEFSGRVILGHQIGRHFGIATANLDGAEDWALEEGVYLVKVFIEGLKDPVFGLLHYGFRKTFGESFSAEVHLFDFDQNLYSKEMSVSVLKKIREVRAFQNADALFSQIERDIIQGKKIVLRRQIMDLWGNLAPTAKSHYKREVIELVKTIPDILQAQSLLLYAPDPRCEIEGILELMQIFPDKKYAFPRIQDETLVFHWVETPEDLIVGDFGIMTPKSSAPRVSPESLDSVLCLVPALALDQKGFRLGRGKGFYDRFLSGIEKRLQTLSLVPDFAFFSQIPHEAHDQKISKVIAVCPFSC